MGLREFESSLQASGEFMVVAVLDQAFVDAASLMPGRPYLIWSAYVHDSDGRITSITPPNDHKHIFSYLGANFLSSYTPPAADPTGPANYRYDRGGWQSWIRPDGKAIHYYYDGPDD